MRISMRGSFEYITKTEGKPAKKLIADSTVSEFQTITFVNQSKSIQ